MFNNLVESGSHRRDLARKGRFMLGTLALYGVLLAASGVASVVAYDARLEHQTLELTAMVAPVPVESAPPREDEPEQPRGSESARAADVAERVAPIARLNDSTAPPETVSTRPNQLRELPDTGRYIVSDRDFDPVGGAPAGPGDGRDSGGVSRGRVPAPVRVDAGEDVPPPTPAPTPAPTPTQRTIRASTGVISSKVITKPAPPYPAIAKAAKVQGTVNVEILIDESGRVVSASAVDGHVMLKPAAVQAARQARFTPTLLGGHPVKVSGVITYNFVLN